MKLVVGLGNPGFRYARTRHNVGFRVVDRVAKRYGLAWQRNRFGGAFARGFLDDVDVGLLKPKSWMNASGVVVAEALRLLSVEDPKHDLFLVYDDIDLPFGRLRLRPGGGDGGHRGMRDVIMRIGRGDFPRLRFGVGRPQEDEASDHVLRRFTRQEKRLLSERLDAAASAVETALLEGIQTAMNRFNPDLESALRTR